MTTRPTLTKEAPNGASPRLLANVVRWLTGFRRQTRTSTATQRLELAIQQDTRRRQAIQTEQGHQ